MRSAFAENIFNVFVIVEIEGTGESMSQARFLTFLFLFFQVRTLNFIQRHFR